MMKKLALILSGMLIGIAFTFPAVAAGTYQPIYQVNESVITKYELVQRINMLKAFGTNGDLRKLAIDQLIDDRLRIQAAKEAGITATEDDILLGMEEFAARGEFNSEQLFEYLRERDVARETFHAFVRAGILWRNVIGARFSSKVNVSDDEVDATLDVSSISFPKTVNVAEIFLPISERGREKTRALAERLSGSLKGTLQFGVAAKKFSKSATAASGGAMGWVPIGSLPALVSSAISALEPGQITGPVNMGSAIAIYQLRGVREAKPAGEQVLSVTYLQVAMSGAKSGQEGQITAAHKLINAGDTCLDMQANTVGFGEAAVSRQSLPVAEVPVRIGAEIARLDPNEATYYATQSGAINVVMLCNRAKDLPEGARAQIRGALFNQRVGSFGNGYLQELRGDAIIIEK